MGFIKSSVFVFIYLCCLDRLCALCTTFARLGAPFNVFVCVAVGCNSFICVHGSMDTAKTVFKALVKLNTLSFRYWQGLSGCSCKF